MFVNVMDLVHLYRHCVQHIPRRIVLSGVLVFQVTFLKAN